MSTSSSSASDKYVRVVSFDTMTNKDLPDYSFTLRGKTPGYKRTRRSAHSWWQLTWLVIVIMLFTGLLMMLQTMETNLWYCV
ncbi:unnamed protein product [Absidia cylindrospora]